MTLPEFLAARLDEREAAARAAGGGYPSPWRAEGRDYGTEWAARSADGGWVADKVDQDVAAHIALNDPDQALREVEAWRKILAEHEPEPWAGTGIGHSRPELRRCSQGHGDEYWTAWPCTEVRAITAVWSDHPDYDGAWRA